MQKKSQKLRTFFLLSVLTAVMCAQAFAASYHTGTGTATTLLGDAHVDSYIYYSSNTTTQLSLTSVTYYISHDITLPATYRINDISTFVTASPSMTEREFFLHDLNIGPNYNTRVELKTPGTFTKGSGSADTSYVLVRPRVALASATYNGITIPTKYVGYDVFFWRDSITKSFHQ